MQCAAEPERDWAVQTERILIADDEEPVRQVLEDFLVSFGYEVTTARGGEEALQKFKPGRFDCVIADLVMPGIDGVELLKEIRETDSKVVFLMITGHPSVETAVEAMKQGAYDYVIKPFSMENIRMKLERALYAKSLEKSLKAAHGLTWGLIISIPIWLILGIVLGLVWRWI